MAKTITSVARRDFTSSVWEDTVHLRTGTHLIKHCREKCKRVYQSLKIDNSQLNYLLWGFH